MRQAEDLRPNRGPAGILGQGLLVISDRTARKVAGIGFIADAASGGEPDADSQARFIVVQGDRPGMGRDDFADDG